MTTVNDVQAALLGRFGLIPRDAWNNAFSRIIEDVGASLKLSDGKLLERAVADPRVLMTIAGKLSVPESFFFRNIEQLDFIVGFIKKSLIEDPAKHIRIWSAGCAQGEEPFSLAVLLKESLNPVELKRVSIFANDISADTNVTATSGIYTPWSLRAVDDIRKRLYFKELDGGKFLLRDDIRRMVEFKVASIQDQLSLFEPASFDVVLCRNVLIYFAEQVLAPLYERIAEVMKEGACLCLSPSDPMVFCEKLSKIEGDAVCIYQKRSSAEDACRPTGFLFGKDTVSVLPDFLPRKDTVSMFPEFSTREDNTVGFDDDVLGERGMPIVVNGLNGVSSLGARSADHRQREESAEPEKVLRQGLALAEQGRIPDAAQIASKLISGHPDRSLGHYLRGQVSLAEEDKSQAMEHFRKAVLADPQDSLARFWYAVALLEGDFCNRSRVQMTALSADLARMEPLRVLTDGQTTVGQLLQAVDTFLRKLE